MLPENLLNVNQIAKRLNVSSSVVRGWIASGMLTCYRLGAKGCRGAIRVAEEDLAAFLDSVKTKNERPGPRPAARKIRLQHLQLPS